METFGMWNPSFLRKTWNKRRREAGLPENPDWREEDREKQHRYYVKHRDRLRRPRAERAAEVAMKLSASELAALFAEMAAMTSDTLARGGQDDEGDTARSSTRPCSGRRHGGKRASR